MVRPLLGPLFGSWCNGMRMPQLKKWCDKLLRLCGMGGRWMNVCALLVEWYRWWKTEVLGNKPDPVLLWPSQTPHELTWNWTQDSIVKGQRLAVTWLKQRCLYEYDLIQFRYPTCQSSSECHSSDCILSPTYTEHLWLSFVSSNPSAWSDEPCSRSVNITCGGTSTTRHLHSLTHSTISREHIEKV
jgi:hypothetical protein